jgi:hypothetical protein
MMLDIFIGSMQCLIILASLEWLKHGDASDSHQHKRVVSIVVGKLSLIRCSYFGRQCATRVLVEVVPELKSITQSFHVSFPQQK